MHFVLFYSRSRNKDHLLYFCNFTYNFRKLLDQNWPKFCFSNKSDKSITQSTYVSSVSILAHLHRIAIEDHQQIAPQPCHLSLVQILLLMANLFAQHLHQDYKFDNLVQMNWPPSRRVKDSLILHPCFGCFSFKELSVIFG